MEENKNSLFNNLKKEYLNKKYPTMQTDNTKKVSVSQYLKGNYTNKSRDTIIRMLRQGLLPENVSKAELIGVTYVLTLKQSKNGK